MKYPTASLASAALLLGAAVAPCLGRAQDATVTGVVRDMHGAPLFGALVELVGPRTSVVAQALTDDHGRYVLRAGLPGEYQLSASGAFLLPATRAHLHVQAGARTLADLTMMAVFEAGAVLPAEKRTAAEPVDDWRWTLRSIANRPLLRWAGDDAQQSTPSSSSADGPFHPDTSLHAQLSLQVGDGGLGTGSTRESFAMRRAIAGEDVAMLKASFAGPASPDGESALTLAAGMEHHRSSNTATRTLVSFGSYPDLRTGAASRVRVLHVATTERIELGDQVTVDAGTLLTVQQISSSQFGSSPFLRVSLQPSPGMRVEYHLATAQALQRTENLDDALLARGLLSDRSGHGVLSRSLHQELIATESGPGRDLSLAVYRDDVPVTAIEGQGLLSAEDAKNLPVLVDPGTGTLRLSVRGYTSTGVAVGFTRTVTPMLVAHIEGQVGTTLNANPGVLRLADLRAHLSAQRSAALGGTLLLRSSPSGTVVHLRYRWQPASTLTEVNAFDSAPMQAYLGFDVRQRICRGHGLPEVDAVLDANNLLAQGDETAVAPSGQAVHLTRAPRRVQGGLAFSF